MPGPILWSTYSLLDPSYVSTTSFGFWIDTGNGITTLVPTLLLSYGRGGVENMDSTDVESPPPPLRGVIEKKHSTDVESPLHPHTPRVCMRGGTLRTSTRPTLNLLLLLRILCTSI